MDRGCCCVFALICAALSLACTTSTARSPADAGTGGMTGCQDVAGPIPGMPAATFDTDVDQFVIDIGASAGTDTNLGDPNSGTTPPPTLGYDGTDGSPTPGSLQIVTPFSGANQYVGAYHFFGCAAHQDWTGKVLHARIKLAAGAFTGDALVYVATSTTCTTYDYGNGAYTFLARGSCWQELTLDLGAPAGKTSGYDPTSVVDFGVQFLTGPDNSDAGPATFLLDSFSVE